MKLASFITVLAALTAGAAISAQTTQKLSATKAGDYAVIYSLPKTAIDVTVVTTETVETPGEFYQFAKRILNIDNPISEASTRYDIEQVIIRTHGEPDSEQRYAVKFGSGSTPYILLSNDNLPLAVNTEETYQLAQPTVPAPVRAEPTPLETPAARQVMTEEMLRSNTPLKRAQSAVEQLYNIRQSRNDLLTGQVDQMPDGQAMQLILDNLNAQEAALLAMFTGTRAVSTHVNTYTFIPPADTTQVSNYLLARLSAVEGIVAKSDLSGAPIELDYRVTAKGEMPLNDKGVRLSFPKNGLPYCIPGKATVKVTYEGRELAHATVNVAQAGVIYGMAPNSFTDKKAPAYLIFDPTTGAAVEIGTK